jgi:hypothetical protein
MKYPDNELLANALFNVSCTDKLEGWAVKHGSEFMYEYPRIDENADPIMRACSRKS